MLVIILGVAILLFLIYYAYVMIKTGIWFSDKTSKYKTN